MFRIGEFSRLSQVSVKTLRYYDEVGLLKPRRVDRFTGYRYYSAAQLPRLNRILAFKDLGFSLEQIVQLLDEDLPASQLRGMLRLKQAETQQRVQEEQERLARIEARLAQIEQEGKMSSYDIVIKKVEPQRVASIRAVIPTYGHQGMLWGELEGYLARQKAGPAGPCLTVYHDAGYREQDVDVEVCHAVTADVTGNGRVTVRQLPGVEKMACAVHRGSLRTLSQAYGALAAWTEANGYRVVDCDREVYLKGGGDPDDTSYVTEVQLPVEKA